LVHIFQTQMIRVILRHQEKYTPEIRDGSSPWLNGKIDRCASRDASVSSLKRGA
jgi:hypothetical protein